MVNRTDSNIFYFYRFICSAFYLLPVLFLSGCFGVIQKSDLIYTGGVAVESFSSNAMFSYASSDRSFSGRGILLFRKPDQIRAVILSPFGSVLQEVYIRGEQITIIDPANGKAFSGNYMELPEKGNLSGWRYIHWLLDIDTPDSLRGSEIIDRTNKFGDNEKAVFENGLLMSKKSPVGGHVSYGMYSTVQKTVFPLEITYETVKDEKFIIQLEDLEINLTLAENSFTPDLVKLRVYPLSSLK
ncbi:MAG: hypothetical protein A2076_08545 [Geobacteraceae bacterium GWC2_53_11]|nr:MAG: hypothetical protein A2076_08545 [Geobacteraceae bacterium GWC2_53_11]